ncbi:hypothetical protein [Frondihabitans sp. VKM Ac-2883]|uniref:hypothetical protein n=1 Tax=Frondihabitans sp. VKM Ac-2883 TaxID=2783823 RepID=UPI00188CE7FF|nr:hypothetical protein [Frondihabitans sp. VKM Ac-2883]MBF4577218.1 hypothetical protein [Frondihabitans sp. VKM Ac-2883]
MDPVTQPLPVVTLAPPTETTAPAPRSHRIHAALRPALMTAAIVAALVYLFFHWATVLAVLFLVGLALVVLLMPVLLLLRAVFGKPGLTAGALIGAIATVLLARRR